MIFTKVMDFVRMINGQWWHGLERSRDDEGCCEAQSNKTIKILLKIESVDKIC